MRGVAATWAALAAIAVPVALAGSPALRQDSIPTYGVSLKVPAAWIGIDPSKTAMQHLAYAVADPKAAAGFHANLNLLVTAVPSGTPVRTWLLGNAASKYLAIGTLKTVTIHGVTGLEYASSRLEQAGGRRLYTLEFAFNHAGRAYLFTYTAPASAKAAFDPLFHASAATIRFVVSRPGSA